MGLLDSIMADDSAFMVDSDGFGETVLYVKSGVSGSRSIKAVVLRNPPDEVSENPAFNMMKSLVIEVRNDSTYGVSSSELKTQADKITVAEKLGGTASDFLIVELLSQDPGVLRLQLR